MTWGLADMEVPGKKEPLTKKAPHTAKTRMTSCLSYASLLLYPRQGEGLRQGGGRRRSFRSRRVPLKDCCVSQHKHIVPTKPPKAPAAPKHQGSVKYGGGQTNNQVR